MKLFQKTLLAVVAGSLVTVGAQAATNYGMTAQPYIGAKVGQYDLDAAKDAATSYGIYGGAKFTPNFGVEAEYMTTSDEDFSTTLVEKSEYSADVYGLYATYDYTFPGSQMYAKGRLGVAKNEVKLDSKNVLGVNNGDYSDTGVAGGVGVGYNLAPNAAVELAYDWYPKVKDVGNKGDLDASGITLGANFKF
ncbi:porin family protein [Psychrobacter sp.]|uniref:porin family protein n=1 Tax=Psychrobacter sp. TaxID=56811 RepID=UPI0025EEEB58|nr:porin family protein [Psychrobacter sp.]